MIRWKPSITLTWKYQLSHKKIFILWTNICWYHQMTTSIITWKIHTNHNSPKLYPPWTLKAKLYHHFKILEGHWIRILKIPINRQDINRIRITLSSILWYLIIFSPTRHPYKFRHSKIKLSIIIKIPSSSPCQGRTYLFLYSTKIKCQNYHLHEYWPRIWPYCWCCICHEYSTWRNCNQRSRPCDLILPWQSRILTTIPPLISSSKNINLSI